MAVAILLGLVISILHTRCFASLRARRRASCRHEKRDGAARARLRSWAHGLRDSVRGSVHDWRERRRRDSPLQDEEKETDSARSSLDISPPPAVMGARPPLRLPPPLDTDRRLSVVEAAAQAKPKSKPEPKARRQQHDIPSPSPPRSRRSSSGDESDALSTTMEQELAQFRAVAGVVGDMVAAEESRRRAAAMRDTRPEPLTIHPFHFGMYDTYAAARRHSNHSSGHTAPPSPTSSSCPSYTSTDETLPPYDEVSGVEHHHHHHHHSVADGFRYAPTPLGGHYALPRVSGERLDRRD